MRLLLQQKEDVMKETKKMLKYKRKGRKWTHQVCMNLVSEVCKHFVFLQKD